MKMDFKVVALLSSVCLSGEVFAAKQLYEFPPVYQINTGYSKLLDAQHKLVEEQQAQTAQLININKNTLNDLKAHQQIELPLPNEKITLTITQAKQTQNGLYISANSDNNASYLSLIKTTNYILGDLHHQGQLYRIKHLTDGSYSLLTMPKQQHESVSDVHSDASSMIKMPKLDINRLSHNRRYEVTVMVAYTQRAIDDNDGIEGVNGLIQKAVEESNQSYQNSNIPIDLSLVYTVKTDYSESFFDIYTDVERLKDKEDGHMDELHQIRNRYKADITILLTGTGMACGVAHSIMADPSTAFALVKDSCATGYYSFAHEIGHLQGARHIITQDDSQDPFTYGHGHCNPVADTWRTVMAYNCDVSGLTRIPFWSTPWVNYEESTNMGIKGVSNNALVLRRTAPYVSSFR
ncbi:M12 family metallo-peptidase [Spartinivicinus ruber]|uniref:M12 family metallo-peptidase n=1 Tax=Spartinivicinus ruber TaxID=2683272 RepID=UPI0013D06951|nr:M12 family metallo-peptidase [Spartinivicinus ruber]